MQCAAAVSAFGSRQSPNSMRDRTGIRAVDRRGLQGGNPPRFVGWGSPGICRVGTTHHVIEITPQSGTDRNGTTAFVVRTADPPRAAKHLDLKHLDEIDVGTARGMCTSIRESKSRAARPGRHVQPPEHATRKSAAPADAIHTQRGHRRPQPTAVESHRKRTGQRTMFGNRMRSGHVVIFRDTVMQRYVDRGRARHNRAKIRAAPVRKRTVATPVQWSTDAFRSGARTQFRNRAPEAATHLRQRRECRLEEEGCGRDTRRGGQRYDP